MGKLRIYIYHRGKSLGASALAEIGRKSFSARVWHTVLKHFWEAGSKVSRHAHNSNNSTMRLYVFFSIFSVRFPEMLPFLRSIALGERLHLSQKWIFFKGFFLNAACGLVMHALVVGTPFQPQPVVRSSWRVLAHHACSHLRDHSIHDNNSFFQHSHMVCIKLEING